MISLAIRYPTLTATVAAAAALLVHDRVSQYNEAISSLFLRSLVRSIEHLNDSAGLNAEVAVRLCMPRGDCRRMTGSLFTSEMKRST